MIERSIAFNITTKCVERGPGLHVEQEFWGLAAVRSTVESGHKLLCRSIALPVLPKYTEPIPKRMASLCSSHQRGWLLKCLFRCCCPCVAINQ